MRIIFEALIKVYKKFISAIKGAPRCKYYPSCSSYALEAFKIHGSVKGIILSGWRILRCNPWSMGGIDYVPQKFADAFKKKNGRFNNRYPCEKSEYSVLEDTK